MHNLQYTTLLHKQLLLRTCCNSAAAPAEKAEAASDDSKYVTIKSPMIGTFYRKPSPDKDVFVNVGDEVSKEK
jgi:biotin carboxyl carrier protein